MTADTKNQSELDVETPSKCKRGKKHAIGCPRSQGSLLPVPTEREREPANEVEVVTVFTSDWLRK